jgi:hypothetical protein
MLCCPPTRVEVTKVATPLAFKVAWPRVVAPSENVTVPPGDVGDPNGPATVAVNVTFAPASDGFRLDVSAVVVSCLTLSTNAGEVAKPF